MDQKRHTLVFSITLRHIFPPIWRRIEVPASYSFWDLHVAIQDAMPWLDYHLHAFRMRNPVSGVIDEIGIPNEDAFEGEPIALAGWTIPLTAYFTSTHDGALYEYDFGDSWEQDVELESIGIRHPRTKYPHRQVRRSEEALAHRVQRGVRRTTLRACRLAPSVPRELECIPHLRVTAYLFTNAATSRVSRAPPP